MSVIAIWIGGWSASGQLDLVAITCTISDVVIRSTRVMKCQRSFSSHLHEDMMRTNSIA
jgi:hypothetical protein